MMVDMEAMMSVKEIMEVNAVAIAATNTIAEVDLTPPPIWPQPNKSSNLRYGRSGRQRIGRYG